MNLFKRNKKDENTDEFHKEYGVISNCRYILGKFVKYRKSLILFIITGSIAAASMTYLWSFIGKLVIDMIEQQASSPDKDIKPLLYLTLITSAAELLFMWLNTVSSMKMSVGFTYVPQTPISDITTEAAWLYNAIAKHFILSTYSAYDLRDENPNEVVGNKHILQTPGKSLSVLLFPY